MGATRLPNARWRPGALVAAVAILAAAGYADPPLRDAPIIWHVDDRRDIPPPAPRDPHGLRAGIDAMFFRPTGRMFNPARWVRRVGTLFGGDHVAHASNVNSLDEVPNSSWFTNRIGLFRVSPGEAARGPLTSLGPDRSGQWTVVRAKTEGVTPGFNIRDARGDVYVIKFDPPGHLGMATGAGVISGRILHTIGYNVPEDRVVHFDRDQLVVGSDVTITPPDGPPRPMTEQDLDDILSRVERSANDRWRALASKFLSGTPIGPFDWRGRRKDDPNDRIDHEDRRELRGLRMFAAWICHFDTKQGNTLDMYVDEGGRRFVRHYLIDFASTLGAGALGPVATHCLEYDSDVGMTIGRALALGLWEDPWRRIERPDGLAEIGYFETDAFYPMAFKPLQPNSAFANMTDRDGYWAAKIISAFTDEHLEAIVATGSYPSPEAAEWIVRALGIRRDAIARYFFDRVAPLDFFTTDDGVLRFHDLGVERGIYSAATTLYRARAAAVTRERVRSGWTSWLSLDDTLVNLSATNSLVAPPGGDTGRYPFLAVEVQASRQGRWSESVVVYLSRSSWRVVELSR
jgi:hypothetical protein